jgi:hypothetical protein
MTDLDTRWQYLTDGANLAANLTVLARDNNMETLAAAIHAMPVEQVEAVAFAAVLLHAENAPAVD